MLSKLRHEARACLAFLVAMTGCGSASSEETADASVPADAPWDQDAAPSPDAADDDATPLASPFTPFGTATVSFDFQVNGSDSNMDSIAFWEAPSPADTLMFVTSRGDDLVQVWRYPFDGANRLGDITPSVITGSEINGVAVDQDLDRVYITESAGSDGIGRNRVHVYELPSRSFLTTFGEDIPDVAAEANLTILTRPGGTKRIYVSTDQVIYMYGLESYTYEGSFPNPGASTIEELAADDFYQRVYVADEQASGPAMVVDADGATVGSFEDGAFDEDMEGMVLYTCPSSGLSDDGRGLIFISDQRVASTNQFEVFDRQGYEHLGTLEVSGVTNTDGIASTQLALPAYPGGLFAMMNDDGNAAAVGWDEIIAATGLDCDP